MASANKPATTSLPSTPPPARTRSAQSNPQKSDKNGPQSPRPMSSSMTPPPSTQPIRFTSPPIYSHDIPSPGRVPSPTPAKLNISTVLPTSEVIDSSSMEDLRKIAQELATAVKDARMAAAHFQLQHNLLAMETNEAAQRAEVEHQMTRREVEILQAADQRHRTTKSVTPRPAPAVPATPSGQPQIEALTRMCKELGEERDDLEQRLQHAKRLIDLEKDRADLLFEENLLLKRRIRENREHFSRLKSQSPMYSTPRDAFTTPSRKVPPRFPDSTPSHAPFAALLAADQVLNGESLTVQSTPTKSATHRKPEHTRGVHSLSSIHDSPTRARPMTSDGYPLSQGSYSLPISQTTFDPTDADRHDRDSTISISDAEDGAGSDDIAPSHASSLATDMLRKNPASQESLRLSQNAERSSNLLQSKLFGTVKKPGVERPSAKKRRGSHGDVDVKAKKARFNEGVGLGIETWNKN